MYILGVSAFYYDSAACLLRDGEILAAAQEERFSRRKQERNFPLESIRSCLKQGGIKPHDLGLAAFYNNSFPDRLRAYYFLRKIGYAGKIIFYPRKKTYLASAFYPSKFQKAAILVNDGENPGIIFGRGQDKSIEEIKSRRFNFSLGRLYAQTTAYLGFRPHCDEYKVMGLSAFGRLKYRELFLQNIPNGSWKQAFRKMPYVKGGDISQEEMDISASLQAAVESKTLEITEALYKISPGQNLCISGALGLNCLLNAAILRQGLFKNIWIQPAAGDAGCAVGAAFLAWHEYLGKERSIKDNEDKMQGALLGPAYRDKDIEEFLVSNDIAYKQIDLACLPKVIADLIAQGNIVGWFQGRMEFGPRALGARSILADPRNFDFHDRLNLRVKFRENFRPFAPVVLAEKAAEYFELKADNPYMLLVADVKAHKKDEIPAVVHVDGTSRVQTIERRQNPLYYDTIYAFYQITGCPALINTSFNTKGEPIVADFSSAYACFKKTDMDYLIIGSFLLSKGSR